MWLGIILIYGLVAKRTAQHTWAHLLCCHLSGAMDLPIWDDTGENAIVAQVSSRRALYHPSPSKKDWGIDVGYDGFVVWKPGASREYLRTSYAPGVAAVLVNARGRVFVTERAWTLLRHTHIGRFVYVVRRVLPGGNSALCPDTTLHSGAAAPMGCLTADTGSC